VRKNLKLFTGRLATIKTHLNGKDLLQMGIPEGHKVGQILLRLLTARIDGDARTKEDEINLVHHIINGK